MRERVGGVDCVGWRVSLWPWLVAGGIVSVSRSESSKARTLPLAEGPRCSSILAIAKVGATLLLDRQWTRVLGGVQAVRTTLEAFEGRIYWR